MKHSFESLLLAHGAFAYTCVGRSMQPLIRQRRDIVTVVRKTGPRLRWLDVPLYRRAGGECVLHRVLWVTPSGYVVCGDNQWRLEFGVTDGQVVGVLAAVRRNGVAYEAGSWQMRLYSYLQFFFFPLRAVILLLREIVCRLVRSFRFM